MRISDTTIIADENTSEVNFFIDMNDGMIRLALHANSTLTRHCFHDLREVITQPDVNNEDYKIRVGRCDEETILYLSKNTNIPVDDPDSFYEDFTKALDNYLNDETTNTSAFDPYAF